MATTCSLEGFYAGRGSNDSEQQNKYDPLHASRMMTALVLLPRASECAHIKYTFGISRQIRQCTGKENVNRFATLGQLQLQANKALYLHTKVNKTLMKPDISKTKIETLDQF